MPTKHPYLRINSQHEHLFSSKNKFQHLQPKKSNPRTR